MELATARVRLRPLLPLLQLLLLLMLALCAAASDQEDTLHDIKDTLNDESRENTVQNNLEEDIVNLTSYPDDQSECSFQCNSGGTASGFERGRRYTYAYDAETFVGMKTSSDYNGTAIIVMATAVVDAVSNCQLLLRLRDARVRTRVVGGGVAEAEAAAEAAHLQEQLQRRPLRVGLDDTGRVVALCPAADEARWSLNIKRGLLSAMQGRQLQPQTRPRRAWRYPLERDVSGLCLTEYSESGEPDHLRVTRIKDLATCAHRARAQVPFPAGAIPATAGARPPFTGTERCSQRYAKGILVETLCKEELFLRPFSTPQSRPQSPFEDSSPSSNLAGAMSRSYVSLNLVSVTATPLGVHDALRGVTLGPRTTLQFQPEEEVEEKKGDKAGDKDKEGEAQTLLQRLAEAADAPADADADVPALFRHLTSTLRRLNFEALDRLFRSVAQTPVQRRLLLEALPGARSAAAARLAVSLHSAGALAARELDDWLTARALRAAPSADELAAFAPLVTVDAPARTLLAAGALVHSHCGAPSAACASGMGGPAGDVVARLLRALGPRCRPRAAHPAPPARAEVLLRALGNAGLLGFNGADILRACYQDAGNAVSVRVAAVEALRRVQCDVNYGVNRESLLALFASARVHVELRIAAYLAAMRCPSQRVFQAVRDTLRAEEHGQVTSFVWSHLRNIQTSSLEWKSDLSAFLEDNYMKEKFNTEGLKFSRNYESSWFFESIDSGAAAEANVIFTPDSYLPRSAAVNLSVEVLGQPLNLLELGARAEGLEGAVEELFGPNGPYPSAVGDLLAHLRGKQDAELKASLERLSGRFGGGARVRGEPRAALFARVLGQDVVFTTLADAPTLAQPGGLDALVGAAGRFHDAAVDFTRAFDMDEATYVVPTSTGLPLTLSLRASGLVRVRAALAVNASGAAGELAPSASLGVDAAMVAGTPLLRAGVRVTQRARASLYAGADAYFGTSGVPGRSMRLALRAPSQRLELLEATSQLLYVRDGAETAVSLAPTRALGACTGATLERALGLRACLNATFKRSEGGQDSPPFFPLAGPTHLRLALDKTDRFQRYELLYDERVKQDGTRTLEVRFDCPGSALDRAVVLTGRASAAGPAFALAVRSPAAAAAASLDLARNATDASADLLLSTGDRELLRVSGALHWAEDEDEDEAAYVRLQPRLEARAAGHRPLRLAGEFGLQPGARYNARIVFRGAGEPVLLAGELRTQDGGYSVRGDVACPLMNGSLWGNVTAGPGECASDLHLEYEAPGHQRHSAAFSHHFIYGHGFVALNTSTEVTQFPAASHRLQLSARREDGLRELRLRWEQGGSVWKAVQRLRMASQQASQAQPAHMHVQALALLSCPQRRVDYKINLEHKAGEGNFSTRGEAVLGWRQRYTAGVQMTRAPGPRVTLDADASTPSVRATLSGKLVKLKFLQGELVGELLLPHERKHKLVLSGAYKSEEAGRGAGRGAGPPLHELTLELRGAVNGQLRGHVVLGPDGVEHALRLVAGRGGEGPPTYAHLVTYRIDDERHLFDGEVFVLGRNFSASVEAVRSPTEQSTVVRLPFSTEIVISSKFLVNMLSEDEIGSEAFLFELSWDKHLRPNNFVALNWTLNKVETISFAYPNQHIYGMLTSDTRNFSLDLKWNLNKQVQMGARWDLASSKGYVFTWLDTPFENLEKQSLSFNYSVSGGELFIHSAALLRSRHQNVTLWGRRSAGALRAALSSSGTLLTEARLALEHDARASSAELALLGTQLLLSGSVARSEDGRVAAVAARANGPLLPLPPCELDYGRADDQLHGSLHCAEVMDVRFRAREDRPKGDFSAWMLNRGNTSFVIDSSPEQNTLVFDTRNSSGQRVLFMQLEHQQQAEDSFSIRVDSQWRERSAHAVISSDTSDRQRQYKGAVTGDLELSFSHEIFYTTPQFPAHFVTRVMLPRGLSANCIFQGRNLLNWETRVQVGLGDRGTGQLHVEQVLNGTVFAHRWRASVPQQEARAELSVGLLGPDFPLELQLQRLGAEPVGLSARLGSRPLLRLNYPQHALEITGIVDLGYRSGVISAQILVPQSAPLNITTKYSNIDGQSTGTLYASWKNESVTAEGKALLLPGTVNASLVVHRSPSQELLYLRAFGQELKERMLSINMLGRSLGKEARMDVLLTVEEDRRLKELTLGVITPFHDWANVNFSSLTRLDEHGVPERIYRFVKNNDKIELFGKSQFDWSHSETNFTLSSSFPVLPNASITMRFDRRDPALQTLEMGCAVNEEKARLAGAVSMNAAEGIPEARSLYVVLTTPLDGIRKAEVQLNHSQDSARAQELALLLRKDEWRVEVRGNSSLQAADGVARAALAVTLPDASPVRHVALALRHHRQAPGDHLVVAHVMCDGKVLETNVSVAASDGELAAFLDTRSSMHGYGPLSARFNLAGDVGAAQGKALLFQMAAGRNRFNLTGHLAAPSPLRLHARLRAHAAAWERSAHLDTRLQYDLAGDASGRRFATLSVALPGETHVAAAEAVVGAGGRRLNASLEVASPRAGRLSAAAALDASQRGALRASAWASASAPAEPARPLLHAALHLNNSILTAQVVSRPVGLNALSLAASWAPRPSLSRYARLHLHLLERELSAEANATHDLRAVEVAASVSGADGGRLHARYDTHAHAQNLTAVLTRANDTLTLWGSLAGPHVHLYAATARLGRVQMEARLRTPEGSALKLFVDDANLDRVLQTEFVAKRQMIGVLAESRFADLRKLNVSVGFDIAPNFHHAGLDLEYVSNRTILPSKLSAKIDRKSSFLRLNHFLHKLFPENIEAVLVYDKLFEKPSNPSYIFTISTNNTKIFRSSANFLLDWEREIGINIKMNSQLRDLKWKMGIGGQCQTKFPATMHLNVTDQTGVVVQMDGAAVAADRNGFTYHATLSSDYGRQTRAAQVEYYPDNPLLMSVDTNATSGGAIRRYRAALAMDTQKAALRLELATPVQGYENLTLDWRRVGDALLLDAHTTFPGMERVGVRARFHVRDGDADAEAARKVASLYIERNGTTMGGELHLEQNEGLLNVSCELELLRDVAATSSGAGARKSGFNVWYDVRTATKSIEVTVFGENTHRAAASFSAEPDFELHVIADVKKIVSSVDVSFNTNKVDLRGILLGNEVADFYFKRNITNNSLGIDTTFRSSFMSHPLKLRYDYIFLNDLVPEIRVYVIASAMDKTSTLDIRTPFEHTGDREYNIFVNLPNVYLKAEAIINKDDVQGRTSMRLFEKEVLRADVKTTIPERMMCFLSIMDEQKMEAKLNVEYTADKKIANLEIQWDESEIFNAEFNSHELEGNWDFSAYVNTPTLIPKRILMNFKQNETNLPGISLKHQLKRFMHLKIENEGTEMTADVRVISGNEPLIEASIQNGRSEVFLFKYNVHSTGKYIVSRNINTQLEIFDSNLKFTGETNYDKGTLTALAVDASTPWKKLERLIFSIARKDKFEMKLKAKIDNEDVRAVMNFTKKKDITAYAEFSIPKQPIVSANLVISSGGPELKPQVNLLVSYGNEVLSAFVLASFKEDNGRYATAQASFKAPRMEDLFIEANFSNGVSLVRVDMGKRTAIAEGSWIMEYEGNDSFTLKLEGHIGDTKARASAGWAGLKQNTSDNTQLFLDCESEGSLVHLKYKMERPETENARGPLYSGEFKIVTNTITLKTACEGVWPVQGRLGMSFSDATEEHVAAYDFTKNDDRTEGIIKILLLNWDPFEMKISLGKDKLYDQDVAVEINEKYRAFLSYSKDVIPSMRLSLSGPKGNILTVDNRVEENRYNLTVEWMHRGEEKQVKFVWRRGVEGELLIMTPWEFRFVMMDWDHRAAYKAGGVVLWKGGLTFMNYSWSEGFSGPGFARVRSPWGSAELEREASPQGGSAVLTVDGPQARAKPPLLYARAEWTERFTGRVHVGAHKAELELSRNLDYLSARVESPRVSVDAMVGVLASEWKASLVSSGELAPAVDAHVRVGRAEFSGSAQMMGAQVLARLVRLPVPEVSFTASGGAGLHVELRARGGALPQLRASARAEGAGAAWLEAEREAGGARLEAQAVAPDGRPLQTRAAVRWGGSNFSVDAAVADFAAGLAVDANPPLLHVYVGDAKIVVRQGLALVQSPGGGRHSLEWLLQRGDGRLALDVQLECAALLPERATLHLQLAQRPEWDGGGAEAEVALSCGAHRHAVALHFDPRPHGALLVRVDADDVTLLALNSSLAVHDDWVDAALHLRFRDTDNSLQVHHRMAFPVHSEISARSPLLLAAQRMSARLLVDDTSLEAEASSGGEADGDRADDGDADEGRPARRRFVAVRATYSAERPAVALAFDSSAVSVVRAFALGAALHDADLGFDADAQLTTADGAAWLLAASAALAVHDLKAEASFVTRNIGREKKFTGGVRIPLGISPETTLLAYVTLPGSEYKFHSAMESTDTSAAAFVLANAPGFDSKAAVTVKRKPDFSLVAQLDSPIRGYEHYRLSINEAVAHSDMASHYIEWGDSRVELRHRFVLKEELISCEVLLTTPFAGHGRYGMTVAYQNGEQKLAVARVTYPGLERDLGIELEYRVRGIFDASLRAAVHTPLLQRLQSASIGITHFLDTREARVYILGVQGEINGRTAGVNVSAEAGAPESRALRADVRLKRDDAEAVLLLRVEDVAGLPRQLSLDLTSPLPALRQLRFFVLTGPLQTFQAVVAHNNVEYVNIHATGSDSHINLVFVNPIKSFSLRLSGKTRLYDSIHQKDSVDIGAMLKWEMNGTLETKIGTGLVAEISNGRAEWSAFFIIPGTSIRGEYVTEDTENSWEHTTQLNWGANKILGYSFVVREPISTVQEGTFRINLPTRSFEANTEHRWDREGTRQSANLLWDAARDRTKLVGYEFNYKKSLWEQPGAQSISVTLHHPLLGEGARVGVRGGVGVGAEGVRAACQVELALLVPRGPDWSAGLEVRLERGRRPGGGRGALAVALADRSAGRELNAKVNGELQAMPAWGARLELQVLHMEGAERRTLLRTEVRAEPREVVLSTDTPRAKLLLRGALTPGDGVEMLVKVDDEDALRAKARLEADSSATAWLELGGGLRFTGRVAAPHRRRLALHVWSDAEGAERQTAMHTVVELKTPRLLSARAKWSPSWKYELGPLLQQQLELVPRAAGAAAAAHADLWRVRWDMRVPWPQYAEWRDFAKQELAGMEGDMPALLADLRAAYNLTRFSSQGAQGLLSDVWSGGRAWVSAALGAVLDWVAEGTHALVEVLRVAVSALGGDAVLPALGEAIVGFQAQAASAQAAVLDLAASLLTAARGALLHSGECAATVVALAEELVVDPLRTHLLLLQHSLVLASMEIGAYVHDLNNDISTGIMQVKEMRDIQDLVKEGIIWITGPFQEFLADLLDTAIQVVNLILNDLEKSLGLLWEKFQQMAPSLPPVLWEIYQQAEWVLSTYVVTEQNLRALRTWSEMSSGQPHVQLDLERGTATLLQTLPVDWEGFDQPPRFDQLRSLVAAQRPREDEQDAAARLLRSMEELTTVHKHKRALLGKLLSHALPSFSGAGQLLGSQYVVTFDGNTYEIHPDCSYLLAGDLARNSFAIVVHFNRQEGAAEPKRTFTILTPAHAVHVSEEYSVRVNGQPVELPTPDSPFLAIHRSQDALDVAAPGFHFRCHVARHACTVRVSGWQFGRTAGLLGSFDRERARDLALDGAEERSGGEGLGRLVDGWRVGRCRSDNATVAEVLPVRAVASPACKEVFESRASPLSECFARVDVAPYMTLCAAAGPCDAALAYKEACTLRTWLKADVPSECESCRGADGTWRPAGAVSSAPAGAAAAADIVLVLQRSCGGRAVVAEAVQQLQRALRARGLPDARFALVAYDAPAPAAPDALAAWLAAWLNPRGLHDARADAVKYLAPLAPAPALHTTKGRLWADAGEINDTLTRLLADAPAGGARSEEAQAQAQTQVQAALELGLRLRPRAGAARALLLLQCQGCAPPSADASARLAGALLADGSALHVLRLGAPAAGPPRAAPRRKGAQGKDLCEAAALRSRGSVTRLEEADGPRARRVLETTWAARVARSLRPQPCTRFRCGPGGTAVCAPQELVPQNSQEAEELFLQFLQ